MCVLQDSSRSIEVLWLLTRVVAGQFHKLHAKDTLELLGAELRIGRTNNVPNPYKEPKPTLIHQFWKPFSL